jgi:diketogulonate reductase-like aldo/keto reductase
MASGIPLIGLGTWQATDPAALEQAIIYAVEEAGYRYIDTAHSYGNEAIIGEALAKIFAKGKIKRSDLFITTKLALVNHRPENVEPGIRSSLARLKLDYLDLLLIHQPIALVPQSDGSIWPRDADGKLLLDHVDILDTWSAMEPLVEKGLTKHIGVSNFSIEMLERMEFSPRVKIQPFAVQIEHSIYNVTKDLSHRLVTVRKWSDRSIRSSITTRSSFSFNCSGSR